MNQIQAEVQRGGHDPDFRGGLPWSAASAPAHLALKVGPDSPDGEIDPSASPGGKPETE